MTSPHPRSTGLRMTSPAIDAVKSSKRLASGYVDLILVQHAPFGGHDLASDREAERPIEGVRPVILHLVGREIHADRASSARLVEERHHELLPGAGPLHARIDA